MEIRKVSWDELHEVAKLWGKLAEETGKKGYGETAVKDYFNHITYKVYTEKSVAFLILVLVDGGAVRGYVQAQGVYYTYGRPGLTILVDHAYINPEYRGAGHFWMMKKEIEDWAKGLGATHLELHAEPARQKDWERAGLKVETIYMSKEV